MNIKRLCVLAFFFTICINIFAQVNSEEELLKNFEKRSYKIITFYFESANEALLSKVNNILLNNENIILSNYNLNNKVWQIHAWLNVQKEDVITIIGVNGIKTSDYKENIVIKENKTISNSQFANLNEVEQYNLINNILFEDFPKLYDTGNQVEDLKDYDERKQKWINDNPEKYNLINSSKQKIESEDEKNERIKRENHNK